MAARAGGGLHRRPRKFLEGVAGALIEFAELSAGDRHYQGSPPHAVEHVWRWYCELGGARTSNGFGLNPISYSEIRAWADLTGADPTPWEVSLLKRLDMVTLANQKASTPAEGEPDIEVRADDMEGVKALFRGFQTRAKEAFKKA